MSATLRQTLSHASIYGIGNAAQRLVGFVMLPIYTRYLTPADYGVISMMQILLDLTGLFFGMQIATGVFRHYYQEKDDRGRREVLSTALSFTVAIKGAGAILLSATATPASWILFGSSGYESYVALFAFALLTDSLTFIPFQYVRILERPYLFVSLSLLKLFLQLGLNLLFIVHLDLGVKGVVYSTVISGAVVGGGMCLWLISRIGLHFRWGQARSLVGYSWPLILSGLIGIYLSAGSRFVLSRHHGLEQVGLMSLAWQFALVLRSMIWQPFNQAWGPQRFKLAQLDDRKKTFQRGFLLVTLVLTWTGTAVAVLADEVLDLMAAPAFHAAVSVVPLLVLGEILRCMTLFANTPLLVAGKTVEMFRSSLVAAFVFSILLMLLVPTYSIIGAAAANAANAAVALWWVARKAREVDDLEFPWWKLWAAIAGSVCVIVLSSAVTGPLVLALALKLALLIVFGATLIVSPLLDSEQRSEVVAFVRLWLNRSPK